MSKRKKKVGLQKDFSTIFEGVWIPPKPRGQDASPQSQDQDAPAEDENAVLDAQEPVVEMPESNEPKHNPEPLQQTPKECGPDSDMSEDQGLAVEMPLPEEKYDADEADAAFEPNPEIEKIISTMKCSKGFICYKSNFQQLCRIIDPGEGKIIECSPLNQGPCSYRFSFMGKVFCKCPLRYYIAKNLGM